MLASPAILSCSFLVRRMKITGPSARKDVRLLSVSNTTSCSLASGSSRSINRLTVLRTGGPHRVAMRPSSTHARALPWMIRRACAAISRSISTSGLGPSGAVPVDLLLISSRASSRNSRCSFESDSADLSRCSSRRFASSSSRKASKLGLRGLCPACIRAQYPRGGSDKPSSLAISLVGFSHTSANSSSLESFRCGIFKCLC